MICNRCGTHINDGSAFCPKCGNRMSNTSYNGQTSNSRQTGYYGYPENNRQQTYNRQTGYYTQPAYGAQAAYAPAYAAQPVYVSEAPARKRKSKAPLVILIIIVMIAAAAGAYMVLSQTAVKPYEKAVDNLVQAMNTGDYDLLEQVTVGYLYDDLSYNMDYTYNQMNNFEIVSSNKIDINEIVDLSEYWDYLGFLGIPEVNEVASVKGNLDGEAYTFYVGNIDGSWKVFLID